MTEAVMTEAEAQEPLATLGANHVGRENWEGKGGSFFAHWEPRLSKTPGDVPDSFYLFSTMGYGELARLAQEFGVTEHMQAKREGALCGADCGVCRVKAEQAERRCREAKAA